MNNLLTLIKIEFSKSFSLNSMKRNKAKTYSFLTIISLVVLLGIGLSAIYSFLYGKMFIDNNLDLLPLFILFSFVASLLTFFSGMNQTRGIFTSKDYDLLSVLPLRKRTIIASKIINLYLVELLYSAIILIPCGVVLTVLSNNVIFIFMGLITALFVSGLPLVVSIIFSFISSLIADRFKFGNVILVALYVVFLGGIMALSFFSSSNKDSAALPNAFTQIGNVVKWIFPSIIFVEKAYLTNFLFILLFVAINILSVIIVVLVISIFFDKIHEIIFAMKANYKYVRKDLKIKNELRSLLDLEFKRLTSSKLYFFNSITGLIMAILMTIVMTLTFSSYSPFGVSENLVILGKEYGYVGGFMISFSICITNTACVGISIEGKNFWLVKSLPIHYKKYMWAKLLLAYILLIPISLICSTIMVVLLLPNLISIIGIYLIPLLISIFVPIIGLLINSIYYKLKWMNEQEVVKNSMSVVLTMLIGFVIDFVVAGLLIGLSFVSSILAVTLSIGLFIVLNIVFYLILRNTFEDRIEKIEDF